MYYNQLETENPIDNNIKSNSFAMKKAKNTDEVVSKENNKSILTETTNELSTETNTDDLTGKSLKSISINQPFSPKQKSNIPFGNQIKTRVTPSKIETETPFLASKEKESKINAAPSISESSISNDSSNGLKTIEPNEIDLEDTVDIISTKADSTIAIIPKITPTINLHRFNFVLGVSIYNDINFSSLANRLKTGLNIGVEYEYLLKPYLSFSSGVHLNNRTSDNANLIFDKQNNGFGDLDIKTTYSYSEFYFIEIPVTVNYLISSKHKIGAGPVYNRLITTKVDKTEEVENSVNKTNSYSYHYNTFSLNNYGINGYYQYNTNRFGINLGYTYGLNNFLNTNTFQTNKTHRLTKLQLSIKYNI